ncbi:hypothetical protein B0H12DRAFT_1097936 [Mycena haematopus]|nr:hypothetical protein B0H12DRAFT_1097936 [Mycena haematopus]
MLPASLRSLVASAYYGLWASEPTKTGFIDALAECISTSSKEIAHVEGSGGKKGDERQNLLPIVTACREEKIPCNRVEDPSPFVAIFFGTKVSSRNKNIKEVREEEEHEDTDSDDEASFQDVLAAIPTRFPKLPSSDGDVFS